MELLVLYHDIILMLQETKNEERKMGFKLEGHEKLQQARDELENTIDPRFIRKYKHLRARYKRPIAPVQNDTCLGCFAKLPTSYGEKGRNDQSLFTCEQCGRILYWIE